MSESKNDQKAEPGFDHAAAFPTAQWVAAMRAVDAKQAEPKIGANVGGGPDLAAALFAGEVGVKMLKEHCELHNQSELIASNGMVARSRWIDAKWMDAVQDGGITQVVVLAAGLDARAWRLPLTKDTKVYEVDCAPALEYKESKAAALKDADKYPEGPACTRLTVAADLADNEWPAQLEAAGFDKAQPSFFLTEGLLMYLPDGAPGRLFKNIAGLMSPGSQYCGDSFVGFDLGPTGYMTKSQDWLQTYGTKWTFAAKSRGELSGLIADGGLVMSGFTDVLDSTNGAKGEESYVKAADEEGEGQQHEVVDEATATAKCKALIASIGSWSTDALPLGTQVWLADAGEKHGLSFLIDLLVKDDRDHFGLLKASAALKARIRILLAEAGAEALIEQQIKLIKAKQAEADDSGGAVEYAKPEYVLFHATAK